MDRLYPLTFVIPANTPLASPVSLAWPLEDAHLVYVEVIIPPGPSGLSGFRINWAQQQVIPWGNNSYLITDNEKIHIDVDEDITATGLVAQGYNTDIFLHTFYFRALIRDNPLPPTTAVTATSGAQSIPADILASDFSGIDNLTGVPLDMTTTVIPPSKNVPPFRSKKLKRLHPRYVGPPEHIEPERHEHEKHRKDRDREISYR